MIESVKAGDDINISGLEPPNYDPSQPSAMPEKVPTEKVTVASNQNKTSQISGDPAAPADTMDALNMRIEKFSQIIKAAKEAGNGGKARRHDRLLKVLLHTCHC